MTKKDAEIISNKDKFTKNHKLDLNTPESKQGSCCMGTSSCSTSQNKGMEDQANTISSNNETKKGSKTRIIVKYDVGFSNLLAIRGKGASLSWEKGCLLKNIKNDEWLWETEALFTTCEFKILINDKQYETGENHLLRYGTTVQYTPRF